MGQEAGGWAGQRNEGGAGALGKWTGDVSRDAAEEAEFVVGLREGEGLRAGGREEA